MFLSINVSCNEKFTKYVKKNVLSCSHSSMIRKKKKIKAIYIFLLNVVCYTYFSQYKNTFCKQENIYCYYITVNNIIIVKYKKIMWIFK